jgi:hypothetical protein
MPYTHCPSCRLAAFTASTDPSREKCPRCGTLLGAQPRRLFAVPGPNTSLAAPPDASPTNAA